MLNLEISSVFVPYFLRSAPTIQFTMMDQMLREFENKVQAAGHLLTENAKSECKRFLKQMEEKQEALTTEVKSQRAEFEAEVQATHKVQIVQDSKVQLNVGGHHFSTSVAILRSKPGTLLDAMFSGRYALNYADDGSVFIDRDGRWFTHVLNYLKNSVVELEGVSVDTLCHMKREFDFFDIELLVELAPTFAVGGEVRGDFFFGEDPRSTVERLDAGSATWETVASMGTARQCHSVCSLSHCLYAIGGWDGNNDALQSVEKYDISLDAWTSIAPLLTGRYSHGSCVVGETIYVLGGEDDGYRTLTNVEKYDTQTDSWSPGRPMPAPRSTFGVCVVADRIYVIGGFYSGVPVSTVFVFDCSTEEWSECASLPQPRRNPGVSVYNGCVYVFGGHTVEETLVSGVKYDPAADSWSEVAPMSTERPDIGLFQLDGYLYAVGGYAQTVERYHSGLDRWELQPPIATGSYRPQLVTCELYLNVFDKRIHELREGSGTNQHRKKRKA
jgi:N-acetylneuraminic acid mutarotase